MRYLFMILQLVVFVSLAACQKQEPESRQKSLSKGFRMMDEARFDEAIEYFGKLLGKDPHYHVRIALASAYAGRAGVKIENIYSYAVQPPPREEVQKDLAKLPFDQQTRQLLGRLETHAQQWDKVPFVKAKARGDLGRALQTLEGEDNPGARLYAVALRVVLLKSLISEGVENWQLSSKTKVCGRDLKPFFNWSLQILGSISSMLEDLEVALPKQTDSYREARSQVGQVIALARSLPMPKEDECF